MRSQMKVGNVSPSILVPFYDEDSSTLFLAGKGENVINAYEVEHDADHADGDQKLMSIISSTFELLSRLGSTTPTFTLSPLTTRQD